MRTRLIVRDANEQRHQFLDAIVDLMNILARACSHDHLNKFCIDDLTTFKPEMSDLTGIEYGGIKGR